MNNKELGRRLVACKHFRWMPGMLAVAHREQPLEPVVERMNHANCEDPYPGSLPDLTDPATVGCLLALVRESWGDDGIAATIVRDARDGDYWSLIPAMHNFAFASTEAGALVAALEGDSDGD